MAETKKCEVCEQEIGSNEEVCPKCGTDFKALEEEIGVIQRAHSVIEKRKKAATPPEPEPAPAPKKKRSIFTSLSGGQDA